MKTYNNVPIKREVQQLLFTNLGISGYTVKGLSGNNPDEYIKLLNSTLKPKQIYLYDIDPSVKLKTSGNINIKPITEAKPSNIMDCDFCSSIVSDGEKLRIIYEKMKFLSGEKVISFTFSLRLLGGKQRTISILEDIFNISIKIIGCGSKRSYGAVKRNGLSYYVENLVDNPNLQLVSYKDTSAMLSGTFKF